MATPNAWFDPNLPVHYQAKQDRAREQQPSPLSVNWDPTPRPASNPHAVQHGMAAVEQEQHLLRDLCKTPRAIVYEQPQTNQIHKIPGEGLGQWRPGSCKSTPWTGLLGLVVALMAIAAIIAVLLSANGKATDSWPSEERPIQLAVILAIVIAVGNAGLTLAYHEGVTLTWWVKMLNGGSLKDCHHYWQHGSSALQSMVGVRHFSKISFVSIIFLLLIIDSPLLQRAASFKTVTETMPATFKAGLSNAQLNQPTAYYMTRARAINALSSNFSAVVTAYTNRDAMKIDLGGCDGTCSGSLIAAGFDVSCTRSGTDYDLDLKTGGNATVGSILVSSNGISSPGIITISTSYKGTASETGQLINTNCTLHSAQVRYPFTYANGTLTLEGSISDVDLMVNRTVTLLYPAIEASGLGKYPSLLGGIAYAAGNLYDSTVVLYNSGTLAIQGTGPMYYTYMNSSDEVLGTSNMTWSDPMPSVLEAVRELTFRTAIAFSDNASEQIVDGTELRTTTKYAIHSNFLAGALVIIATCALAVLWLFNGFWRLGRPVSMSPLETAAAFQAPLAHGADTNGDADQLARQVGDREVKYGAIYLPGGAQTRAIVPPVAVS